MNPCGMVVTYMTRQDWKGKKFWIKLRTMFFNLCLFIYQMVLMIVGTAYGKIKWPKLERWQDRIIGVIFMWAFIPFIWFFPKWWSIPILIIGAFIGIATFRYIPWRRVWRAAQASHVRLILEPITTSDGISDRFFWCADFGYPKMEVEVWDTDWNKDNYRYFDPTFNPSPEFISPVIRYAHDKVGLQYDDLQLISNGLHLIAWIVMPWCWGKELKVIKAFNRPGGHEHCISGVTACLRWGDNMMGLKRAPQIITEWGWHEGLRYPLKIGNRPKDIEFFKGYSTATTSPCLVPLSKNWEEK